MAETSQDWEEEEDGGGELFINPSSTVFAWTDALKRRGQLDKNRRLLAFATRLEKAVIRTVDDNDVITRDLALAKHRDRAVEYVRDYVSTDEFLREI